MRSAPTFRKSSAARIADRDDEREFQHDTLRSVMGYAHAVWQTLVPAGSQARAMETTRAGII